ncbi:MFS transporter [Mariniflexile sp. HMF6888]|uniref:MFS transporter n=1 Tax=Mariniflexile sp. HMF6888 TaxID=3373086 RepID=UPI00379575AA
MTQENRRQIIIISGILFLITSAVNLEMPLFKKYSENENFGVSMVGFAFASYIGGLIPTALFFGGLSDKIGKKKVLQIALVFSSISILIMTAYPNLYALFFARIFVGVSVALSIATGSSFLSELFVINKETNSSNLVALSTTLGFGGGALMTSIYLIYYTSLVPLTYWIILIASILWLFISFLLAETKFDKSKKTIRLPLFPKGSFKYNVSIALFWAVTGIVISIIPSQLAKFNLGNWSGLSLFLINGTGALFLPIAKKLTAKKSMIISYILLPIGFAMLTFGSIYGQILLILVGCSIVGAISYGFGYFGSLSGISTLNPVQQSRVVSGYLLFAYLGFGIPSIIIGLSSEIYGIENSLITYFLITSVIILFLLTNITKLKTTANRVDG